MGKETGIAWTDSTFNPIRGCSKVSPACKNCYALEVVNRFGGDFLGQRVLAADSYWKQPLKWNADAARLGVRHKVFCASLSDVFENWDGPILNSKGVQLYHGWHHAQPEWVASETPCEGEPVTMDDVRRRLFTLIDITPHLDWQLLTKRPENIRRMWPDVCSNALSPTPNRRYNVWIGTTVENQEQADKRIPELLKCRELSPVLFLSCEPLLGPLNLHYPLCKYASQDRQSQSLSSICSPSNLIDWLICGGESGKEARPMSFKWAWSLKQQCEASGVPFFFKQWGEWQSGVKTQLDIEQGAKSFMPGLYHDFGDEFMALRVGKKSTGDDLLWGQEFKQFPEVVR